MGSVSFFEISSSANWANRSSLYPDRTKRCPESGFTSRYRIGILFHCDVVGEESGVRLGCACAQDYDHECQWFCPCSISIGNRNTDWKRICPSCCGNLSRCSRDARNLWFCGVEFPAALSDG